MTSPALLTDLYELTMAAVYVAEGTAERPATFSLFVRDLPPERGFLVAAGLADGLDFLEQFRFSDHDLEALDALDRFDSAFLDYLRDLAFVGSVRAVPEGTVVFPDEPILEVDAPLAAGQIVETFLLNQITLQTVLTTKVTRCRLAAGDAPVLDFALRRTQGIDAGMKLVRAGRIAGIAGTSNVAGAARYGLRAAGTMAHSFVQAYEDEIEAFRAFARRWGDATVLLVDTYDTLEGVRRAVEVAGEMEGRGEHLRGIRIDSGDLLELSRRARSLLDEAGFEDVGIFVSGGLDEFRIEELRDGGAPVDGFGVGTAMGVSNDAPSLDSVYKLVEFDGRPVRKTSEGKTTWPGRKQVWRRWGEDDVLGRVDEEGPVGSEPLLVPVMEDGYRTVHGEATLDAAAERLAGDLAALPEGVTRLRDPEPYPVEPSEALLALTEELGGEG